MVRSLKPDKRARRTQLGADVGIALTHGGPLRTQLQHRAEAIVLYLDAAFARIWTINPTEDLLELQASAGLYTHLDGTHGRVPVGSLKIGLIAKERRAHLTNAVVGDPRVSDQDWARQEGMVSVAGYPLLVDNTLVGVMAMFARHALTESTLTSLGSIADEIALGIARTWADEARAELLLREQAARAEADIERGRLQEVIRQAPALIAVTRGSDHVFEFANPLFLQVVSPRNPLGKPAREGLPDFAGQGYFELLDEVYATDTGAAGTESLLRFDRTGGGSLEDVYFTFVYQPMHGAGGEVAGILIHAVEVTEQVRARQAIQETLRLREEFLSAAAHDLQTPLTAIKGGTQLLQRWLTRDGTIEPGRLTAMLATLDRSATKMSRLVGQLLDAARLQAGRGLELDRRPTDLVSLVGRVVEEHQRASSRHEARSRSPRGETRGEPAPWRRSRSKTRVSAFQRPICRGCSSASTEEPMLSISLPGPASGWPAPIRLSGCTVAR